MIYIKTEKEKKKYFIESQKSIFSRLIKNTKKITEKRRKKIVYDCFFLSYVSILKE